MRNVFNKLHFSSFPGEISLKTVISHTFLPDGKEAYEEFISKLSGLLIHKGFKIVSGYGLGVGSAVISKSGCGFSALL